MKIYDLSPPLKTGMWNYGAPYIPFEMEKIATLEKNGYIARKLTLSTHMGSHIECEAHWKNDGIGVDQLDLNHFVGNGKVIQFSSQVEPYFEINKKRLIEAGGDKLKEGDICILSTGWDCRIDQGNYAEKSPFITIDAASYLCEKKIKLMAADFPMCGDPRDGLDFVPEGTPLPDTILFEKNIPIIVGLVQTNRLPNEVFFVGSPLKIEGADGSPVRAIAIELG
ncbi:cyclase family protein [Lentibacillus sp. N15]|uniref:cyclase family protein n=1 Tax=Lentibacillus songyuanensis TaxID=3136161 RepID=UPI0031B9F9C9